MDEIGISETQTAAATWQTGQDKIDVRQLGTHGSGEPMHEIVVGARGERGRRWEPPARLADARGGQRRRELCKAGCGSLLRLTLLDLSLPLVIASYSVFISVLNLICNNFFG